MSNTFTRRAALQSGAALAAALGLPPTVSVAPEPTSAADATPRSIPSCPCAITNYGDHDQARMFEVWDELLASATERQRTLLFAFDQEQAWSWMLEVELIVRELQRFVPGVAPIIRMVADPVVEPASAERGRCCWPDGSAS